MRPSRPTTLLTRMSSFVTCWLRSTSALNAAATSASGPSARSRTVKSPSRGGFERRDELVELRVGQAVRLRSWLSAVVRSSGCALRAHRPLALGARALLCSSAGVSEELL